MTKISIIQFNGSNAFEISSGGYITTFPMRAVGFENIAFATQVFTSAPGAGLKVTLREIGATGNLLREQAKNYAPTEINLWQRMETFWPAHADMAKAEVRMEAVGSTVLIAQPKVANGMVTGAYATNFAPQLSKMSPTGIYTGTLVANQILMSETETLDQSLTSIRAGFAEFVKRDDLSRPGTTRIDGGNLTTGKIQDALKRNFMDFDTGEISFADGMFSFAPQTGASIANFKINSDGLSKSTTGSFNLASLADVSEMRRIIFRGNPTSTEIKMYDYDGDGRITVGDIVDVKLAYLGQKPFSVNATLTAKLDSTDPMNVLVARAVDHDTDRTFETTVGAMEVKTSSVLTSYLEAKMISTVDYYGTVKNGIDGETSFKTADGKTVTVTNGIITGVQNG